jgi:predicted nucleic acid-binding Zn ribbon protein
MPRYDYKCSICCSQIEFEKSIGDDKSPICCSESMKDFGALLLQFLTVVDSIQPTTESRCIIIL